MTELQWDVHKNLAWEKWIHFYTERRKHANLLTGRKYKDIIFQSNERLRITFGREKHRYFSEWRTSKNLSLSRKYKDLFHQMFRSMKILLHIQKYEVIIHKTEGSVQFESIKNFSEQQNIQILLERSIDIFFFFC